MVAQLIDADDRVRGVSPLDELWFLASLPAASSKVYHVYLAQDRRAASPQPLPSGLTANLSRQSGYPYRLDLQIGPSQYRLDPSCRIVDGRLEVTISAWAAVSVTADITSPDGQDTAAVPLERAGPGGRVWRSGAGFDLPAGAPPGIWRLSVRAQDARGRGEEAVAAFVVGAGMWTLPLVEKILPGDPPRYGCDTVRPAAARNQAESFQLFIETTRDLPGVTLSTTDLAAQDGKGVIPSSNVTFRFIDRVSCPLPEYEGMGGLARGPRPDPLLPWRSRDLPSGRRASAERPAATGANP